MPHTANHLTLAESQSLRLFLISVSLVATICISSGFLGIAFYSRGLIYQEMLNSARRNFTNIVLMRRWNASYGGVYVFKRPGVQSNPYLENPDITAVDGKVYTLKNPALMTREISELLKKEEGFFFHITSLRPLNPGNEPDAKERAALLAFENGQQVRTAGQDRGPAATAPDPGVAARGARPSAQDRQSRARCRVRVPAAARREFTFPFCQRRYS